MKISSGHLVRCYSLSGNSSFVLLESPERSAHGRVLCACIYSRLSHVGVCGRENTKRLFRTHLLANWLSRMDFLEAFINAPEGVLPKHRRRWPHSGRDLEGCVFFLVQRPQKTTERKSSKIQKLHRVEEGRRQLSAETHEGVCFCVDLYGSEVGWAHADEMKRRKRMKRKRGSRLSEHVLFFRVAFPVLLSFPNRFPGAREGWEPWSLPLATAAPLRSRCGRFWY